MKAGVTYTAAAGNEAVDAKSVVPASFPEVIAVSAIVDTDGKCGGVSSISTSAGRDDTFASFSNYGPVVDIAAPGVLVRTTASGGTYTSFSGTSASTPHVTGAAALYKSTHADATPSDIRNALISSGTKAGTACDGKGHGYFTGDHDTIAEPLLYVASSTSTDTTPPTVTSTDPTNSATNVAISKVITAAFSEPVQSTSVSTSTFILKAGSTTITGTVGLNGNTASFTPSSKLTASTTYTATIKGGTAGVKDTAGNAMTSDFSWSFTTAAAGSTPTCDNNLAINTATASGSQSTFVPTNAIDNNLNTKWWSTFIVNPWIRVDLGSQHAICSVSIAWADGTTRQYSFTVSVSTDGSSFSNVFSGKSSGTSASPQKYSFAESQARYVKITVTQSHAGSSTSIAQISEVDVFGKTGTSSLSSSSSYASSSQAETELKSKSNSKQSLANNDASSTTNHPPIAKADKITTNKNIQILIAVMSNDVDPDGDKLSVISASSHSKNGGIAKINSNGTITFIPSINFVGQDAFSYSISDGKGKSDKAKASVIIKSITGDQPGKKDKQTLAIENQYNPVQGQDEKSQLNNQLDNNNQQLNELKIESTPNSNNDTATSN